MTAAGWWRWAQQPQDVSFLLEFSPAGRFIWGRSDPLWSSADRSLIWASWCEPACCVDIHSELCPDCSWDWTKETNKEHWLPPGEPEETFVQKKRRVTFLIFRYSCRILFRTVCEKKNKQTTQKSEQAGNIHTFNKMRIFLLIAYLVFVWLVVKLLELSVQVHELLRDAVDASVQVSVLAVLLIEVQFIALSLVVAGNGRVLPAQWKKRKHTGLSRKASIIALTLCLCFLSY